MRISYLVHLDSNMASRSRSESHVVLCKTSLKIVSDVIYAVVGIPMS